MANGASEMARDSKTEGAEKQASPGHSTGTVRLTELVGAQSWSWFERWAKTKKNKRIILNEETREERVVG